MIRDDRRQGRRWMISPIPSEGQVNKDENRAGNGKADGMRICAMSLYISGIGLEAVMRTGKERGKGRWTTLAENRVESHAGILADAGVVALDRRQRDVRVAHAR